MGPTGIPHACESSAGIRARAAGGGARSLVTRRSEPDVEAGLLEAQLRWIAACRHGRPRFAAVQYERHEAFRNTTHMASNRLTGIPTRPALVMPAERIPSMRRSWKTISEAGTTSRGGPHAPSKIPGHATSGACSPG